MRNKRRALTKIRHNRWLVLRRIPTRPPKTPTQASKKIPEKSQKILNEIAKRPDATRKELAATLSESEETIRSRLRKLVKDGMLKRVGPDKGRHWETHQT
jgi:ATP-dependent DNA helicase RecG